MDFRPLLEQILDVLVIPKPGEPGRTRHLLETELLAHQHYLLAVLAYKTRDPGLAEDLLQETWLSFLSIAQKKEFLPEGPKLRNYLLTIALNKLRDHARSRTRQAARSTHFSTPREFETWIENLEDPAPDPARAFARADEDAWRKRAVVLAMERLPDRQREILELKFARDLDNQALAEKLQLGLKAVESLLFRAKASFRKELEKVGLEEDLPLVSPGFRAKYQSHPEPANEKGQTSVDSRKGQGNGTQERT